jgi:hypothetical protein
MRYIGGGHKRSIVLSILNVTKLGFQQKLSLLNTIQTEQHLSLIKLSRW